MTASYKNRVQTTTTYKVRNGPDETTYKGRSALTSDLYYLADNLGNLILDNNGFNIVVKGKAYHVDSLPYSLRNQS